MPYKLISREKMTYYRKKLNLLIGIMERGCGSKSRVMRHGGLRYDTNGDMIIRELIEEGSLKYKKLRGDRNWITITKKGTALVKEWRGFEEKLEG